MDSLPEPAPAGPPVTAAAPPAAPVASPLAALAAHKNIAGLRERTRALLADPDFIPHALAHIENGGSLVGLAEVLQVRYSDMLAPFLTDKALNVRLEDALKKRDEWEKEMLLSDIRARAAFDIRQLYGEDGQLKPLSQWPADAARFVEEITTDDLFDGQGKEREKVGETRKVKLESRVKNKELLMRARSMLVERREVVIGLRLEDIMAASNDPALAAPAPPAPIDAEIVTAAPPTGGFGATIPSPIILPEVSISRTDLENKKDPPTPP